MAAQYRLGNVSVCRCFGKAQAFSQQQKLVEYLYAHSPPRDPRIRKNVYLLVCRIQLLSSANIRTHPLYRLNVPLERNREYGA